MISRRMAHMAQGWRHPVMPTEYRWNSNTERLLRNINQIPNVASLINTKVDSRLESLVSHFERLIFPKSLIGYPKASSRHLKTRIVSRVHKRCRIQQRLRPSQRCKIFPKRLRMPRTTLSMRHNSDEAPSGELSSASFGMIRTSRPMRKSFC